jgi:hypothetical protein
VTGRGRHVRSATDAGGLKGRTFTFMALPGSTSPPGSPSKNRTASTTVTAAASTTTGSEAVQQQAAAAAAAEPVPLRSLMTNAAAKKNWRLSFTISAGYKV